MKKIIILLALLVYQGLTYSQWSPLVSPTSNSLNSVQFLNPNTGFIAGALSGSVIKTTNGGTSWIFTTSGSSSTFYDLLFINDQTGFVAGNLRQVVKTTNSGTNWDIKTSGTGTIYSMSFPTINTGYAVGGTPAALLKSTDSGNNWNNLTPPTSNLLKGVYFIDNSTGWLCGTSGTIWKTTDGCISWIPQTQSSSFNFEKILFINGNTGFVIGTNGVILKTTNSGTNWTQQATGNNSNLFDIAFISPSTLWAVGVNRIIKSTDTGNTWYPQNNPSPTSTYNSVHMLDANIGYIVGSNGILLKTTNGGGPVIIPCFTPLTNDPVMNDNAWGESCAWGDYDNDGDQDLVVTNYNDLCFTCTYPLLLYRNDGGSFTKILTGPIATENTRGFGCAWGDYDNDGWLDLFVATGATTQLNNLLFHNNGNGTFTKITSGSIVNDLSASTGCSWIDYDKDGWIDMFVVNAYSQNDFLYKNNGNGTFTRVITGDIVNDGSYGRGCAVGDYNNDGWPDIFVTCYQGETDRLYRNNGNGTFTLTNGVIPSDNAWGSGASFGDYDNDGWLDLFVTNHNFNNRLFRNNGNNTFSLTSSLPSNETGPVSFGITWADYDNDGRLDLFVSNYNSTNMLYRNQGSGSFTRISNESIATDITHGIGNSSADINLDGKLDFFVANNGSSVPGNDILYRNSCQSGNYIGIKLKGCTLNKSAIGAKVTIKVGGNTYIREVSGGQGYHSQNMLWQHFGVGSSTSIDSIIVTWTTGNTQKLANVTANQYILIDECLVGLISNTNEIPKEFSLSQNYPNPFNPTTQIEYSIVKQGNVKLNVFDITGKLVLTLVNEVQTYGTYRVDFDGTGLATGIYIYKIETAEFSAVKKMILAK